MRIEPLLEGDRAMGALVREALTELLPDGGLENQKTVLTTSLPILQTVREGDVLRVRLVMRARENAFKFFFEMMSNWLVPGRRLPVPTFFALDVRLPDLSDELFSFADMVVALRSEEEWAAAERNLPMLRGEICLGLGSAYHASRILEFKGASCDVKTAQVQARITALSQHHPRLFGPGLIDEMQSFLMACSDRFKKSQEAREIWRVISLHYLMRRSLQQGKGERHVRVKVKLIEGKLTAVVGLTLEGEHEVFGKGHLLKAVASCLPGAVLARDTFVGRQERGVRLFYFALTRLDGSSFSGEEIERLRTHLAEEIRGRVQQQMHPLFLPRNDEEIMRHIVTVSHQLRYVRDLPQVILNFEQQGEWELSFLVVFARVVCDETPAVTELFAAGASSMRWVIDSCRKVGKLRGRCEKEAVVLRGFVDKSTFLRSDNSIDVYRARQEVVIELQRILGDFRDYYGGVIAQQGQLLSDLKRRLGRLTTERQLMVEQLFHTFSPCVLRAVEGVEGLHKLFDVVKRACAKGSGAHVVHEESDALYLAITSDRAQRSELLRQIGTLQAPSSEFGRAEIKVGTLECLAIVLRGDDGKVRRQLLQRVNLQPNRAPDTLSVL